MEVAFITGCAAGMGRALALELDKRRGKSGEKLYKVWATDRQESVKELEAHGISTAQLDVTSEENVKAVVSHVLKTEGRIDMLVCCAGIATSGWMTEIPLADVKRMFDVNVFGSFRVIQAVAPQMMDRRKGKIATFSSVNSYVCQAFGGSYAGSKASVAMMTEALRIELEPFGITVTSVIPGWVKSQIMASAVVRYDKYSQPTSHYHKLIYRVRENRVYMEKQGITTQKAAFDIANGLTKPKPKRYVYTGTWIYYSLFAGFLQTWICGGRIAKQIQKQYHMDQKDKLGRGGAAPPPDYNNSKKVPLSLRKEE